MEAKAVKANDIERYKWCHLTIENVEDRNLKIFAMHSLKKLENRLNAAAIKIALQP
jgi:hypothetical protein